MTKLRTRKLSALVSARSLKNSGLPIPGVTVCIVLAFCIMAVIAAPAQSFLFTSLYSFGGRDGANPGYMSLVRGSDGNLYGTTVNGGTNNYGTIFKITPSGTLTTLYSFCSQPNCIDGGYPEAPLMQPTDGNFYGTTSWGGANGNAYYGTVFKITPAGALTTLYNFCSQHNCTDGRSPSAGLVQGTDGDFYGATPVAGSGCYIWGCGTIFKITAGGMLTTLYNFNNEDGSGPWAALEQARDGNFYGTTTWGGIHYAGSIFTITPSGVLDQLYSFDGADGDSPSAALVQASDGSFYGTTSGGGTYYDGTIFKITPDGALTTLYSFGGADGAHPYAGLVQASDGNFYGTTYNGGTHNNCDNGCGTIFKITPAGVLTTLHSFNGSDGAFPYGGLAQVSNGFFYGTTSAGGAYGLGTVFRVGAVRTCAICR